MDASSVREFVCKPHEPFPCSNPQGCGGPFCKVVQERQPYLEHCKNVLTTAGYTVLPPQTKWERMLTVLRGDRE